MEKHVEEAIKEYQCTGCVQGSFPECYEKVSDIVGCGCSEHHAGSMAFPAVGRFFLGMPTGFCRIGECDSMVLNIFEKFEDGWGYDNYNVPVWKYNHNGHTLVRGLSPRTNKPFLHVFLDACMDEINCIEISDKDVEGMD